jgi:hypothetical protein
MQSEPGSVNPVRPGGARAAVGCARPGWRAPKPVITRGAETMNAIFSNQTKSAWGSGPRFGPQRLSARSLRDTF